MMKHIKEALDWFGENITENPVNPANKNLLNVEPGSKELGKEKSEMFFTLSSPSYFACVSVVDQMSKLQYHICANKFE